MLPLCAVGNNTDFISWCNFSISLGSIAQSISTWLGNQRVADSRPQTRPVSVDHGMVDGNWDLSKALNPTLITLTDLSIHYCMCLCPVWRVCSGSLCVSERVKNWTSLNRWIKFVFFFFKMSLSPIHQFFTMQLFGSKCNYYCACLMLLTSTLLSQK